MPQPEPNMPEPDKGQPPTDEFGSLAAAHLNTPGGMNAGALRAVLDDVLRQQFRHWTAGLTVLVETYLDQNPTLRGSDEAILALLDQEVVLRLDRQQVPSVEELTERFPHLHNSIREVVQRRLAERSADTAKETAKVGTTSSLQLNKPPSSRLRDGASDSARRRSGSQVSMMVIESAHMAGFEIIEEIGRGGMGVVYKAVQTALKRPVALKMILSAMHASEEQIARFRREAEAVARVHHANIVAVYDVGEFEGSPYLALEYVDGGSLADRLYGRPWPPQEAAVLIEALARGVYAAHQQGIIHRDLKPANILLTRDGVPKISDFGLAKQMDESSGWTRTGDIMGTPCYMAPEQAEGRIKLIGPATDIYSLGAILYELLTGQPPFRGATTLETLELVRTKEPVPPSRLAAGIPWKLETICLKCLEKKPQDRYTDARQLADDLLHYLKNEPISARRPGMFVRVAKWYGKNRAIAATVAFFLLVMTAGVIAAARYLLDRPRDRDWALGGPTQPLKSTDTVTPTQPTAPEATATTAPRGTEAGASTRSTLPTSTEPGGASAAPTMTLPTAASPTRLAMETRPAATATSAAGTTPTATMVARADTAPRTEAPTTPVPTAPTTPTKPATQPRPLTFEELLTKAREEADPAAAIDCYLQLYERIKSGQVTKEPTEIYDLVLMPALEHAQRLGEVKDDSLRGKLAVLYAAKGRLLRENPYEGWRFGRDVMLEAAEAYRQAIQVYPKRRDRTLAEYHTGHGIALTRVRGMPQAELLAALQADAQHAIDAAPDYAGGWNLRGFALSLQASQALAALEFGTAIYRQPPRSFPVELLNQAIEAYDQAVVKARAGVPDENLPVYYQNRSAALLLLGYCQTDPNARRLKFEQAEADAQSATEIARNYDLGWQALGFAREALASKASRIALADRYETAMAAFRQQSDLRPGNVDAQFNLARCLARQAVDGVGGAGRRDEAVHALRAVLQDDPQHAEAHFWLGQLLHADKPEEARTHFVAALQHPQQGSTLSARLAMTLSQQPAEVKQILSAVLPAKAEEWQARHVPLLLLRARAEAELAVADTASRELSKAEPAAWLDAEAAFRLAAAEEHRAAARFWAAFVRFQQYLRFRTESQKRDQLVAWLKEVDDKLHDMLRRDDKCLGYFEAVNMLTNVKFIFGTDRLSPVAERKKALEEAVRLARGAEDRASPAEKAGWRRIRQQLQEQLQKLDQEQP